MFDPCDVLTAENENKVSNAIIPAIKREGSLFHAVLVMNEIITTGADPLNETHHFSFQKQTSTVVSFPPLPFFTMAQKAGWTFQTSTYSACKICVVLFHILCNITKNKNTYQHFKPFFFFFLFILWTVNIIF